MPKIIQKRYVYDSNGQKIELFRPIPIKGARIIHTDPRVIAEMNAESIQKHAEWLKIMAACEHSAHTYWFKGWYRSISDHKNKALNFINESPVFYL